MLPSFKEMKKLSAEDSMLKNGILKLLQSGYELEKKREFHKIPQFNPKLLFALAEDSAEINHLFETDPELQKEWARILKDDIKLSGAQVTSFDKKVTVSLFSQIKGAYLVSLLENQNINNPNALELLNKACELGMGSALNIRMNYFINKL